MSNFLKGAPGYKWEIDGKWMSNENAAVTTQILKIPIQTK